MRTPSTDIFGPVEETNDESVGEEEVEGEPEEEQGEEEDTGSS